jgi:metal-responsive CopG/Arc/MetJ family transcriptional regulator
MKQAKKHHPRRNAAVPVASLKRVIVEVPAPLLTRAERAIAELSTNRSELFRMAVEQYLETLERTKLERELAEGYIANAAQARQVAEELFCLESDLA